MFTIGSTLTHFFKSDQLVDGRGIGAVKHTYVLTAPDDTGTIKRYWPVWETSSSNEWSQFWYGLPLNYESCAFAWAAAVKFSRIEKVIFCTEKLTGRELRELELTRFLDAHVENWREGYCADNFTH